MRNIFVLLMLTGILVGCGLKEIPQIDTRKPPHIEGLKHDISGNILRISFTILEGDGPVGYQIDRAEIDPHCNCPESWQRFFEQPVLRKQKGKVLTHMLNLRNYKRAFVFRLRPVDMMGNLGAWSKSIHARAEKMIN